MKTLKDAPFQNWLQPPVSALSKDANLLVATVLAVILASLVGCKKELTPKEKVQAKPEAVSRLEHPHADQKADKVRWEYTKRYVGGEAPEKLHNVLNELGNDGWEVVGFYNAYVGKSPRTGDDMTSEAVLLKRRKN